MKKVLLFLSLAIAFFTSCNMGENGDAFLRVKYYDTAQVDELMFVELYHDETFEDGDQTYVETYYEFDRKDWKEYFNCYFRINPGIYTLYYKFKTVDEYGDTIIDDYCCEIEIWINEGRSKHRDGTDVKFDLTLYDKRKIKFEHEEYQRKSFNINESTTEKYVESYSNGQYEIRCTYYPVND